MRQQYSQPPMVPLYSLGLPLASVAGQSTQHVNKPAPQANSSPY